MPVIQPASRGGTASPQVLEITANSGATFLKGAPLQRVSGTLSECEEFTGGATVTGLIGFALQAATAGVAEFGDNVQLARALDDQIFLGQVISAAAVVTITSTQTYTGNDYGLLKASSGVWYVDADDETNVHVNVIKQLPEINCVLFKVIASVQAD